MFQRQAGKCALTGLPMHLNSATKTLSDKSLRYASLDRLDNAGGYTIDNVQFVCLGINYMRNTASLEEARDFIRDIITHAK